MSEPPPEALALQPSRTVRRLGLGFNGALCIQNVRNNTLIPLWSILKPARLQKTLDYVSGFVCAFNLEHEQGVLLTSYAKSVP